MRPGSCRSGGGIGRFASSALLAPKKTYVSTNQIMAEESAAAEGVHPFQVRKIQERSFLARVFGGSRSNDAETAVENLIAERGGLDNVDVVAIDNCLHQTGVRDTEVKASAKGVAPWDRAICCH